jgi:hypothetical protein
MTRRTPRKARKSHRCHCGAQIAPGDFYLELVISPTRTLGNKQWWRAAECMKCVSNRLDYLLDDGIRLPLEIKGFTMDEWRRAG